MITLYLLLTLWCLGFTVGSYLLALGFVSWLDDRETRSYAYVGFGCKVKLFDDVQ